MLGFPLAAAYSMQASVPKRERDLYARLFDRFNPGGAELDDKEKNALFRQGLLGLAAGMASTGGQGFMGALGNGLQTGLLAMNNGVDGMSERAYRERVLKQGYGDPAGLREFQAMTEGLSDAEKMEARRVHLGLKGRASSAGMTFGDFTGLDGRPRPMRSNPRTGAREVFFAEQGRWVELGANGMPAAAATGSEPAPAAEGEPPLEFMSRDGTLIRLDPSTPLEFRRQVYAQETTGMGAPVVQPAAPVGLGVGRSKEEEAAAVAAATAQANLGALPTELALRSGAAVGQAAQVADIDTAAAAQRAANDARIKNAADTEAKLAQRSRDASAVVGLLDEAQKLIGDSTGSAAGYATDTALGVFGRSTKGSERTAQLRTIAGQLTSKMPRMEGPQSNYDVQMYKEMAGDLANPLVPRQRRLAALQTIRRLNEKYAAGTPAPRGGGGDAPRRLKFNPATGRIE